MQITFIGLGKMGNPMAVNAAKAGHKVYAFDLDKTALKNAQKQGINISENLSTLVQMMKRPRIIWMMLPQGKVVDSTLFGTDGLVKILERKDTIIDGGNSYFRDSIERAARVKTYGLDWLDIGVSGGRVGAERGYAMMAGGDKKAFDAVEPVIKSLSQKSGYGYFGQAGSGHFVKMVHNSIEYGMMQAIAEGFNLLKNGPVPQLDLQHVANVWNHGTIVESFLMEMAERALTEDKNLKKIAGFVNDTGEGRWAVQEALNSAVPYTINTEAVYARFNSRGQADFAYKLLAAMRNKFGGHAVKKNI